MFHKAKKLGLALGGGGARGFAHIGVLKVLEREKIHIDYLAGTSMGAIVGGMYAQNPDIKAVEERMHSFLQSPNFKKSGLDFTEKKLISESWFDHIAEYLHERIVVNIATHKKSVVRIDRIYDALDFLLENDIFQNTKIPFAAVASDLCTGEEVVIKEGSVRDAVAASAALPGFLPPVTRGRHLLIDGGATSAVPIKAVKALGAHKVIAVDVSGSLPKEPKLDHIIDYVLRSYAITAHQYHNEMLREADIVLQPKVGQVHWSKFSEIDWLIREGERKTENLLHKIKKL